jgi:hypothetical protein
VRITGTIGEETMAGDDLDMGIGGSLDDDI